MIDRGPLLVLLGALCFSTTGTICALFMPEAGSLSLTMVRAFGAAVALGLVALLTGRGGAFLPVGFWLSRRFLVVFVALSVFTVLFFAALRQSGVTVATVVTIGTVPVFVGILARCVFAEPPAPVWYPITALALAGVACLGMDKGLSDVSASGVLLAMASGASYGVFVVFSRPLLDRRPVDVVMTMIFGLTACVMGVVWAFDPGSVDCGWVMTRRGFWGMMLLVAVPAVGGYLLSMKGFALSSPSIASTMALGEPMGATVWGVCLLGEPLSALAVTGVVLLFVSMVLPLFRRGGVASSRAHR